MKSKLNNPEDKDDGVILEMKNIANELSEIKAVLSDPNNIIRWDNSRSALVKSSDNLKSLQDSLVKSLKPTLLSRISTSLAILNILFTIMWAIYLYTSKIK